MKNKLINCVKIHDYTVTSLAENYFQNINIQYIRIVVVCKTFVTLISKLSKDWMTGLYGVYFSDNNCHMLRCLWKGAMTFYMMLSPMNVLSSRRDGVLFVTTV